MSAPKQIKKKPVFKTIIAKGKPTFDKPPISRIYVISLILGLLTIIFPLLLRNYLPPELPLFYGAAQGQDQLTSVLGLVIPGIYSVIVTLINTSFALLIKNKFLQHTLIATTLVVTILCFITTLKIIFLVGSLNL